MTKQVISASMHFATATIVLLFGVLTHGCSRATPVQEVTIDASGVRLSEDVEDQSLAWAAWRGPTGNGVAPDQSLPTAWSESEGVSWRADVPGRGHSSPIVVGDQVFLATAIEDAEQQLVLSYDRNSGQQLWSTIVHEGGFPKAGEVHKKGTNANGSVASDGQRVYVAFFNSGKVTATALDLNGDEVWREELGSFRSKFGFASSPVMYKSFVIFAVDHLGGGYLAALDAATGKIAWRIARPTKNSHSTPFITNLNGTDQMLISGCDQVVSYDPKTGKENWSFDCIAETTCGTMVATSDKVFASGGWPERQTICLTADGKKVWDNKTKIYEPSMLVAGQSLFAISDDGIAHCWSTESGETLWRKRLGGNFSASPILCNGNIYVSNLSGETFVFEASAEGYQEVSVNQLGSDCYASPAVVDGAIFLRIGVESGGNRREQLVCIGS